MFCISLYILPEYSRQFDRAAFLHQVNSIRSPEVDASEEKNQLHLAFHFFTEFPKDLWSQLSPLLLGEKAYSQELAKIAIIACEGEDESDYWLLHHPDKNQKLDKLV